MGFSETGSPGRRVSLAQLNFRHLLYLDGSGLNWPKGINLGQLFEIERKGEESSPDQIKCQLEVNEHCDQASGFNLFK